MARQSYNTSVVITRKVTDLSDKNLFFKFFVRNIILALLLSALVVFAGAKFSEAYFNENIEEITSRISLKMAEAQSNEMSLIERDAYIRTELVKARKELLQNGAVKDAAFIFFDISNYKLIATSSAFAVYDDEELYEWYKTQTDDNDMWPTILPDSLIEFYDTHRNVVIKTASYLNGSLVPEEVGIKGQDGVRWDELKRADEHRPTYDKEIDLVILGNRKTDPSMASVSTYAIRTIDKETNEKEIIYDELQPNIQIKTKTFTINDTEYRIDIAYNYGFVFFASKYLIAFELGLLILCAGLAYLRLREHRNMYS